ncbi:PAS domain S-box protein [Magnetofaba australis]|uniref:Sensory/regulatory protein RpfC n=1 Tax=Magnetofaba australis IT-1 TaxID=1434232 RepID=A0A1Y2K968_9PROT|nr:PAS domain S-box protein [Magnetofaba australis]OSM07037.1 putative sensor/response regulatory hybrid protein [Magnetofaba australis IT-1]
MESPLVQTAAPRRTGLPFIAAIVVMVICLLLALFNEKAVWLEKRERATLLAHHMTSQINQQLTRDLFSAKALAALVRQGDGHIADFDEVAQEILRINPTISSLQLAPAGVVRHIVPLAGNEKAIGHDLLSDKNRNKEALSAIETRSMTLAGPFTLIQGGVAVIGRQPVFLKDRADDFWGFTSVLIRLEDVTRHLRFAEIEATGYSYQLWRNHPNTGARHVFAQSQTPMAADPITQTISVPNGQWFLSVVPQRGWFSPLRIALEAMIALLAGALAAWVMRRRQRGQDAQWTTFKRLELATSLSGLGIWVWEPQRNLLQGDQRACKMFGLPAESAHTPLQGDVWFTRVHASDHDHVKQLMHTRFVGGESVDISFRTTDANGETHWIQGAAFVDQREAQGSHRITGVFRDITDQRQTELALRDASDRMKTLLDTASDGIHILDETGNVVEFSQTFAQMLGYSPDEVKQLNVRDWEAQLSAEDLVHALQALLKGARTFETRHRRKDGVEFDVEISAKGIRLGERQLLYASARDISGRKQSEARLQESLEFSRTLLLQSPVAKGVYRASGECVMVNESMAKMVGAPVERLLKQNFRLIPSWRNSGLLDAAVEALRERAPRKHEIRLTTSFGREVWAESLLLPATLNGEDHLIAQFFDLTDAKRKEARLRSLTERFELAANALSLGIWTWDLKTDDLEWNKRMFELYQAPKSLWISQPSLTFWRSRFHEEDLARLNHDIKAAMDGDKLLDSAFRITLPDGSLRHIHMAAIVERDDQGHPVRMVGINRDITAEHAAEEALVESELRFRSAFETAPHGMALVSLEGRWLKVNQALCEIIGYSEKELLATDFQTITYPDDLEADLQYVQALLAGQINSYQMEKRYIHKNGGLVWILLSVSLVRSSDGSPIHFVAQILDITEAKQVQEELIQARHNADAANIAKSQFLANMSHEIRTPMNAVLGLLQLTHHTLLDDRQKDYIEKAEVAARSLLGILNDILDYSKIEANRMELETAPFDLAELFHTLASLLSTTVSDKDVEILFDIDGAMPTMLSGDALRLQQVLINLTSNAVKFTPKGSVTVALTLLESTAQEVTLEFSVSDTGIGISDEKLSLIFEGFSQAEASTTRRFGGTGLGLAISRRLVELMGGELQVISEEGKGSRFFFTLTLPLANAMPEQQRAAPKLGSKGAPLRALIVDDSEISRDVLARMVVDLGGQAHVAQSGHEAIKLLACDDGAPLPYDLVLLDWKMPGMDGWETARYIRNNCPSGSSLIFILITAYGREMVLQQHEESPGGLFNGFLTKPVTHEMLREAILTAGRQTNPDLKKMDLQPQTPLHGMNLLVVEDNPTNQQVAQELLSIQGAEVVVADNGAEGVRLAMAAEPLFDAVLMDIQMSVMDGFEATRILRERFTPQQLPILAMTANALSSDREACLAAQMNDHVGKPFDVREVVAKILTCCGRTVVGERAPPPSTRQEAAQNFPGFDYPGAMARFNNRARAYLIAIAGFQRDLPVLLSRLESAINEKDRDAFGRHLHALKGLAGTLGAVTLSALARHCEAELASGDALEPMQTQLNEAASQALEVIEQIHTQLAEPQAETSDSATELDADALRADLDELDLLLAEQNLRMLEVVANIERNYGAMLGARLKPLLDAVNGMDIPSAQAASTELRESLEESDEASHDKSE